MRLTCPNCGAQYEVPDEVIPDEGRDVQCSACDQTWFQAKHPAVAAPEPAAETAADPETATATEPTPEQAEPPSGDTSSAPETASKGNVDPAVANILQEEAAREAELRSQEGSGLEMQPDLALDEVADLEFHPKRPAATETAEDSGQKDALPDIEAINSGMLSEDTPDDEPPVRKSGGFVRGLALMLIIGVILYLIYGNAQKIGEAVPQADPVLSSYVSMIDQARIWLETQAGSGASQ